MYTDPQPDDDDDDELYGAQPPDFLRLRQPISTETLGPTRPIIDSVNDLQRASEATEVLFNHCTIEEQIFGLPVSRRVALSLTSWVTQYFNTTKFSLSSCRAWVLYSLTPDYGQWPIVEWREGDMEMMAIFHFDDDYHGDGFCDCLTHYSSGKHSSSGEKGWIQQSICWTVNGLNSLKSLVVAMQHLLGRFKALPSGNMPHESMENLLPGEYTSPLLVPLLII